MVLNDECCHEEEQKCCEVEGEVVGEVVNGTVVGEEDDADQDDQVESTPYAPGNASSYVVTKIQIWVLY